MLTNLLIVPTVKAAVEALQNADKVAWKRLFAPRAVLYDDGSPRDLRRFMKESFGRGRFICIDRVANSGFYIEGDFHSEEWGDSRTYLNFELNNSGRIVRLDVGKVEDGA
ncbi:MAG: hypothetical protein ABR971_16140 [Acidobacteriaceae bacterium]